MSRKQVQGKKHLYSAGILCLMIMHMLSHRGSSDWLQPLSTLHNQHY
jgi:hypothetical protein